MSSDPPSSNVPADSSLPAESSREMPGESSREPGVWESVEEIHGHRQRLERMVRLRLDRRLGSRIDAADIVQEVFVEAVQRFGEFQQQTEFPLFLWLRFLTSQKIAQMHRFHLKARKRAVGLEIPIFQHQYPQADSRDIARKLIGRLTTPLSAAVRAEKCRQVQEALEAMDPLDREVLVMRHFEQLTNKEISLTLNIPVPTASSRYLRSLEKLKSLLQ